MYKGKTFTSDLINSYAWDTAIVFIQKVTNENYANQNSLNTGSPANQGTNKLEKSKQDKICNIWDMASNCTEWNTETNNDITIPCIYRGGNCYGSHRYASFRGKNGSIYVDNNVTFRPLLYL